MRVKNSPELREAHQTVLKENVTFMLRLRQSPEIFAGLNAIKNGSE
jgi:Zn-dependent oligopeptidase